MICNLLRQNWLVIEMISVCVMIILMCKPLYIWQNQIGEPRVYIKIICWCIAIVILVIKLLTTAINDDEVFWLVNAWEQSHGGASGTLLMRGILFRPFLALNLDPSATIITGRVFIAGLAVMCAWLAASISQRMRQSRFVSLFIGPVLLISFATMEPGGMVFLRPEYFAFAFFLLGLWLLLTPPVLFSRQNSILLSFALFALCSSTSLRQSLFPLGALLCILLYPGQISRKTIMKYAVFGVIVGLLPTIVWTISCDSIKDIYYWNVIFPKDAKWLNPLSPMNVPLTYLGFAFIGCFYLLKKDKHELSRILIILWIIETVLAIFNPQKMGYALGPWLTLSILVVGAFISALPSSNQGIGKTRWTIIVLTFIQIPLLATHLTGYCSSQNILEASKQCSSQLKLISWINHTRKNGSVMCVTPYHPIKAQNAWKMSNAWWYANIPVNSLLLKLDTDIEKNLRSCRAAVISWDPLLGRSRDNNVIQFWTRCGFISSDKASKIARILADNYIPVHWNDPLPKSFGGGTFLVRKDLKFGTDVKMLDKSTILNWYN